jgi:hypothetical protein
MAEATFSTKNAIGLRDEADAVIMSLSTMLIGDAGFYWECRKLPRWTILPACDCEQGVVPSAARVLLVA